MTASSPPPRRTSFFEEQARFRRRTLRFAVFGALAVALTGIPVSLMVTPVLYLVVLTTAHLIDLVTPVSPAFWELVKAAGRLLPAVFNPIDRGLNHGDWSQLDWLALGRLGLALVLPGMAFMFLLWLWVRALFWHAGTGGVLLSLGARDPRPDDLEERQLVNVLTEMSIAAGLTPPQVKLLDRPEANAAAVGRDPHGATIVVTRGLLTTLGRDETQAVLGHLIGSICNGDLKIAMLLLSVNQTYGLLTSILAAGSARSARRALWQSLKGLVIRDDRAAQQVADLLLREQEVGDQSQREGCFALVRAPFVLAAASTQYLVMIGQMLLFGPLLAAMWRARRFLADATAVQLTRNPDGMAHALQRLTQTEVQFDSGDSSRLLFVLWRGSSGRSGLPEPTGGWHPSIGKRLSRLQAVGAKLIQFGDGTARPKPSILARAILGILMVIVYALGLVALVAMLAGGVLVMGITLMFVGMALFLIQGFFTILPGLVHWIRYDSIPVAKQIWHLLQQLAKAVAK